MFVFKPDTQHLEYFQLMKLAQLDFYFGIFEYNGKICSMFFEYVLNKTGSLLT